MDIQRISYAVMVVGLGWKDWSRSDIIYGIVVPIIVVLVIVGLSQLSSLFVMRSFGIVTGIISEIEEIVIIVGIPLLRGLGWDRGGGGAPGFLLGSTYSLW